MDKLNTKYKYYILLYSIWFMLNVTMLCISFYDNGVNDSLSYFFPFNYNVLNTCLWAYDISEFIVYTLLLPALVIFLFWYSSTKMRKFLISFIFVCIVFAIVSLFDNSEYIEFLILIIKGILIFMLSYYWGSVVISVVKNMFSKKG